MLQTLFKRLLSASVSGALGRKGMLRLGKFLCNEARLDRANDFTVNGEQKVQTFVARFVRNRENCVILDVGANVGEWSRHLARKINSEVNFKIYAFEPCRETFDVLSNNVKKWGLEDRVMPCNLALTSKNGKMPFYSLGACEGRNSLYMPRNETASMETVYCQTLDQWCADHKISEVAFLKIDAEGSDMDILSGAKVLLGEHKIDMIQFEYSARWISARRFLADVFGLIDSFNYNVGKITWKNIELYQQWHADLETFVEGNYVLVKTNIVDKCLTSEDNIFTVFKQMCDGSPFDG